MPFNNYFNVKRFACLFQQDLLINRTKYLLGILGLGLITYLLCLSFLSSNKWNLSQGQEQVNNYYGTCFVFYMMAIGVVLGTAFPDLTDKIKVGNYLLSPGSTLEKFLVQFLLRIGLFIPIALGIFWIAIRLAKASLVSEVLSKTVFFDPSLIPYFEFRFLVTSYDNKILDTWQILFMIFGFFSYGTYLFAGATYFKRYALVKTVIASAVILFLSISFSVLLSHIFYPKETYGFDIQFQPIQVTENLDSFKIAAPIFTLFSWMFFLAIAYFKLKEKEA